MTKPISIPNTFSSQSGSVPASELDANYSACSSAINDLATYTNYVADTGTANNYAMNFPGGITVNLAVGLQVLLIPVNTNTGASFINVNSLGSVSITFANGLPVGASILQAGLPYLLTYNGSSFLLPFNPAGIVTGASISNSTIVDSSANSTPIGNTAPSTGAFTTLSASSTVSGTGFSTYLASPPAIGGTAPAAGTFTAVTAGTGSFTNFGATTAVVAGNFIPSQTNGIVGTTTNNNANAGSVGEFLTATGSSILNGIIPTSVVALGLSPGDWNVWGNALIAPNPGVSVTSSSACVSTVAATNQFNASLCQSPVGWTGGGNLNVYYSLAPIRVLTSSATIVYVVVTAAYSGGSTFSTGIINARRMR